MNHLVLGLGEIGTAMKTVLSEKYSCSGRDIQSDLTGKFDVLHVCFPYFVNFVEVVEMYKKEYAADNALVIIHSTVPIGVSSQCAAVHSPVRGIHPHLVDGIKTFIKFFGGERAKDAAKLFQDLGIGTITTPKSETTEALKLWETTIYAWNIILEKEIYRYCQEKEIDFDVVYTDANKTYNEGYEALGRPEYKKFILKHVDGPIGGHCLIPNAKLLRSWVCDTILEKNK